MAHKRFNESFKNLQEAKNEVYNTIKSLEKSGYIKSSQKIENGRLKNYYILTNKGKAVLKSAREIFRRNIRELASIMEE